MKNISAGKWVFDSHLLVYAQDIKSPFYGKTSRLFSQILSGRIEAVLAQQNILEAENVLTRVYKKNFSSTVKLIEDIILNYKFDIIAPFLTTYERFHDLVIESKNPVDLFDYYLAATMLDNGINRILTVNSKDFRDINEIEAVNPFD